MHSYTIEWISCIGKRRIHYNNIKYTIMKKWMRSYAVWWIKQKSPAGNFTWERFRGRPRIKYELRNRILAYAPFTFLGLHRNVRQLIFLQNKLNIQYKNALTLAEIESNVCYVYKKRKEIINMAISLSLEYHTKLAVAKEEAGKVKAATYLKSLNLIEQKR